MKHGQQLGFLVLVALLVVGCDRASLGDLIVGTWEPLSINGQVITGEFRAQMQIAFHRDGSCRRGNEIGTFKVVDASTIQTIFDNYSEAVTVEIKEDILIMRMDAGEMHARRSR